MHCVWCRHLRYFATGVAVRRVLCRHPNAGGVQDATQFWAPKPVMRAAAALCSQPERIRDAMEGCLDLWGRQAERGSARPPVDNHLPALLLEQPAAFRPEVLNRAHELSRG